MKSSLTRISALIAVTSVFASACTASPAATAVPTAAAAPTAMAPKAETKDIVDTAVGAGNFNTLAAALTAAGLVDTLKGPGPFTVFAPTDEAFAKLDKTLLANLLKPENKAALAQILTYHVVAGSVMAGDVVKLTGAKTVEGSEVKIKVDGGSVMVDGAKVTATDVAASNGVIHVVDSVLVPASLDLSKLGVTAMAGKDIVDTAVGAGNFNTLATALTAAGLVDTLKGPGPFTVFAPTDEAFAKLDKTLLANLLKPENKAALAQILTYHVVAGSVMAGDVVKLTGAKTVEGSEVKIKVDGGTVMVDGAKVTATDIAASNGVIHVVDSVLVPASLDLSKLGVTAMAEKDIVDTAVGAGSFNTLAAALTAAGLVDTLKGPGPFTVFAPTDEAFAKLDKTTLADLLKPENKAKLAAILTYHVVSGSVLAADVTKLTSAKSVNGAELAITVVDGAVMVNDAKVTATDIKASNGVIHVIDTVMLPPAE